MKIFILLTLTLLLISFNAQAYVGPGLGVGVIGAIVGVLLTIVMAIVGVFWYPIKRMFKKENDEETLDNEDTNSQVKTAEEEK